METAGCADRAHFAEGWQFLVKAEEFCCDRWWNKQPAKECFEQVGMTGLQKSGQGGGVTDD